MRHIQGLYLTHTGKGRSMFSAESVSPGDIIESCPVILIPEEEKEVIHSSTLHDYYFIWPGGGLAIALGYGSIYNHSSEPNARVIFIVDEEEIVIECMKPIEPGEEILIDYSDGNPDHPLWFQEVS